MHPADEFPIYDCFLYEERVPEEGRLVKSRVSLN